jgi:hypothetical protein
MNLKFQYKKREGRAVKKRNGLFQILRGKSGASLLFVLACMFLLLAVGASAMTAAAAAKGAWMAKRDQNQLVLYDGSMQKLIRELLKKDGSDLVLAVISEMNGKIQYPTDFNGTRGQISSETSLTVSPTSLPLPPDITNPYKDITTNPYKDITVNVNFNAVYSGFLFKVTPVYEWVMGDKMEWQETWVGNLVETEDQTAEFSGSLEVEVTTEYKGKTLVSVVKYEFSGVKLQGSPGNLDGVVDSMKGNQDWRGYLDDNPLEEIDMSCVSPGIGWGEVVSHRKPD